MKVLNEFVNGTHVTPSGNIDKFSLDFLGQGEKGGKGGSQHTDGIYISINPIGNAKFHKTYGTKEVVQRNEIDSMGRGGVIRYILTISKFQTCQEIIICLNMSRLVSTHIY